MFDARTEIAHFDPELRDAIRAEQQRQEEPIELIASGNYTSARVMAAQGSERFPVYQSLDQQPVTEEARHGS